MPDTTHLFPAITWPATWGENVAVLMENRDNQTALETLLARMAALFTHGEQSLGGGNAAPTENLPLG
jgi:hypothetical protein